MSQDFEALRSLPYHNALNINGGFNIPEYSKQLINHKIP